MATEEELRSYFAHVEDDKRQFAFDTIEEYIFYRDKITELMRYPDIEVSKRNPTRIRLTPAAKLRKEYSQILDAKRGTLLRILNQVESSAADDLLAKLSEFE